MNIILLGFKSSGKSTTGAALAKHLGLRFIDTDKEIERLHAIRNGRSLSCRDIYMTQGPEAMRRLEADAIQNLEGITNTVIATGGGVILQDGAMKVLRQLGTCVFLDVPLEVLSQRLEGIDSPLFKKQSIADVFQQRYPLYIEAATLHIPIEPDTAVETLVESIINRITEERNGK